MQPRNFPRLELTSSLSLSPLTLFSFPFKYHQTELQYTTSLLIAAARCFVWLTLATLTNVASMNKVVLLVEVHDNKTKKKAMKTISSIPGVESVSLDMTDQKLTLTGDIDAVVVVAKLRKLCHPKILSVGPAKEPKKEEEKKAENEEKDQNKNLAGNGIVKVCEAYHYYPMGQPHYYYTSVEENPNACVIC